MIREAVHRRVVVLACALLAAAGCTGGESTSNKPDVGVKVGPLGGPTTEAGGQVAFVVTLRTRPKGDVVIPISSSNTAEAVLGSGGEIVFTRDDWETPHVVSVVGVDDEYADGHASYEIVFGALQSEDDNYNGLQLASIPGTNLDDEVIGVVVSTITGPTTEAGGEATFEISLRAKPNGIVSVPFASTDESEGTTSGQSREFTPDDWDVPQEVTIEGIDDGTPDGNQIYSIALGPIVSVDPDWDGFELSPVLVANVDDDAPGITVSSPSGATTEAGGTATFTVQLNSQPAANVILTFDTDDMTEGTPDVTSLTFTTMDWDAPQEVTVTGADDEAADGPISYQVEFDAAVSVDDAYDGILPASVDLFNTDDESAAVVVSPVNGLTSETGSTAVFDVVLAAQPANDVVVEVSVSKTKEASVTPSMITFTTANWDVPVSVTVKGKNDFLGDGHQAYELALTPTGDATYAASSPAVAFLTNLDNGPPARVVVFNDNFGTLADDAAVNLELDPTVVGTQAAFLTELAGGADIVVWEGSTGAALDPGVEPALTAYLSSGGRIIYSDTDLDGQAGIQLLLDVTAANPYTIHRSVNPRTIDRGSLFVRDIGNAVPDPLSGVDLVTSGAGVNGVVLTVSSSGEIAGTFIATTSGALAITRDDLVIVNGFTPDDLVGSDNDADSVNDMVELYENEFLYFLNRPVRQRRFDFTPGVPILDTPTVNIPLDVLQDEVIASTRLSFHIEHTFDGDLDIHLVRPDASLIEITTDNGGGGNDFGTACSPDSARTTFTDDAPGLISSGSAPFVGSFRPEGAGFGALVGTSTLGTWTLRIDDDGSGDIGEFMCGSLHFILEEE